MQGGFQKFLGGLGVFLFLSTFMASLGVRLTKIFSSDVAQTFESITKFLTFQVKANGASIRVGYLLAFLPLLIGIFIFQQGGRVAALIMLGLITVQIALILGLNTVLP